MEKEKFIDSIKRYVNENPLESIALGTGAAASVAKLIDSVSGIRSKNAYAKAMNKKSRSRK